MNDAITVRRELAERYRRRAELALSPYRIELYLELADELDQEAMEIERKG